MDNMEKVLTEFLRQVEEARVKNTNHSEAYKSYNEGLEDAKSILISILYDEVVKDKKVDNFRRRN